MSSAADCDRDTKVSRYVRSAGLRSRDWLLLVAVFAVACGQKPAPASTSNTPAPAPQTAAAGGTVPHGDHDPHHGGVVMMRGDLHYEVVLDPSGKLQLFFSDAVREDLPASIASRVSITVRRDGQAEEVVALEIDGSGESWIGSARPVADPATATVRIAFTVGGEPYSIDLPFRPLPAPSGS
jgi:hypothetical protein